MYLEPKQLLLQKQVIIFKEPHQKNLNYLFNNKRIQDFIDEVAKLESQGKQVSQEAKKNAISFKEIIAKTQISREKLNSPKTGWKTNKIDSKSQLAVKVTGTNVELRYEGILEANIENLCIMIYQASLFDKWVPFCSKAVEIAQVSPLQKTVFLAFKIPFLTQRYAYFYGLGIDRIDKNGTIVIYGEGITQKQELIQRYGVDVNSQNTDGMVIMDLKFFICEISYKSKNQFVFRSYCEIDSRMPILPGWIVNAVIKQMGGFIFDRIIKQSQKFKGSVWEKKMDEEKDNAFYPWLHKRMDTWHRMHQSDNSQPNKPNMGKI